MTTNQNENQQQQSEKPNVVMMKLGHFSFSVETAAYQSMQRDFEFKWERKAEGKSHEMQFNGFGSYKRSLRGVIYPEYKGGFTQVDEMAAMAWKGEPLRLLTGTISQETTQTIGKDFGFWCITNISETGTFFHRNGSPRKLEFSMDLVFYGNTYEAKK